jgi:hypothetical protein
MRRISALTRIGLLLLGSQIATIAVAFTGEELGHPCLDSSDNLHRIAYRDACHTLATDSGYRVGVLRPCDRGDVHCNQIAVCPEPQVNYVCVGYQPDEGDCTKNSDCSTEDYCMKAAGQCGGRGVCEPRPTSDGGCPAVIDPVCGCNDKTYSNSCLAAVDGENVSYAGECR